MRVTKIWEEYVFFPFESWVKLFSTQPTLSQLFFIVDYFKSRKLTKMADAGESAPKGGRGGFGRGRGRG
jgi:hypothetical protein